MSRVQPVCGADHKLTLCCTYNSDAMANFSLTLSISGSARGWSSDFVIVVYRRADFSLRLRRL